MGKNNKSHPHNIGRRQALGFLGSSLVSPFALHPVEALVTGLVSGIVQNANAQVANTKPRNYVVVYLEGGPARWTYDGLLCPYSNPSGIIADPTVLTRFSDNGTAVYSTAPITRQGVTLNMPTLWGGQMPVLGGGTAPIAALLDNMAIIRGVDMQIDGHTENARKQIRPVQSAPSLDGLVADKSTTPVPSASIGYYGVLSDAYKAASGKGIVSQMPPNISTAITNQNDPLLKILGPFDRTPDGLSTNYLSRRQAFEVVMNRALASLGNYASSKNPGSENLYNVRSSAESLLKKGIGDVAGAYTALTNKYSGLIRAAASSKIPGVTDKPVPYSSVPRLTSNGVTGQTSIQSYSPFFARNADLTTLIQPDTYVEYLAPSFAIAEFLITNGYSSSVQCGIHAVQNVYCEDIGSLTDGSAHLGNTRSIWLLDEHAGGSYASLIINSFMYVALSACLYELIRVLKSKNLFNETLIHLTSEFNRVPRAQAGTDHAPQATVNTLISGAITKPIVLGNIYTATDNGKISQGYRYCYGAGAPVAVDNTVTKLGIGNSTSTVARLLRVDPPLKNNVTLLVEGSSGVSPTIELAKNILPE
jgi:hypothetical protein